MKPSFIPTEIDLYSSLPLLIVVGSGVLLLLLDAFSKMKLVARSHHRNMPEETSEAYVVSPAGSRFYLMPLSVIFLLVVLGILIWQWTVLQALEPKAIIFIYKKMLAIDSFGLLGCGLCVVFSILSIVAFPTFFKKRSEIGEAYPLIFFSLAGMMILILSNNWASMFVGIETLSLGVYVLTGLFRRSQKSSEAALKYFLNGAFVSAILLYGIALIYGASGTTVIELPKESSLLWLVGAFLILGSLAFKIAAVPLHMWAPDTYEGAPSPVTGFMMSAVKASAIIFLVRFLVSTILTAQSSFALLNGIYILSGLSMLVGNLMALRQDNVKRLLGYSSIAHAGYLLIGILLLRSQQEQSLGIILYYLLTYGFSAIGCMAIASFVGRNSKQEEVTDLRAFDGLGKKHPFLALIMTIFLLSLAGFPPTAGFIAKFLLLRAAVADSVLWPLFGIALLTTAIGVAYYLKIVMAMYFRKPTEDVEANETPSVSLWIVLVFITITTLGLGILPNWCFQIVFSANIRTGL